MRAVATLIGIFAFFLAGCGVMPQSSADNRKALDKVAGPNVGSMDNVLKDQAQQALASGDCKHAQDIYKQLLEHHPDNKEYELALADSLRRCGENDVALKLTEEMLKKDPKNPAMLESKGLCLMNLGEFTEAGTVFGEVMKADSKRWRTLNAIGILFTMKNMNTEAIAYYRAALAQNEYSVSVMNNMALTYAMDRQYDKSVETFERAKRHLPPGSREIKALDLNLALVYATQGKLEEAEQTAAPHLTKEALYNNMGFYAYLSKNTELAKGYLNMALTQSTTYYERAWKNLNLLSGSNSSEENENPDASPAGAKNILVKKSKASDASDSSGSASAPVAGVPMEDIPESKPSSGGAAAAKSVDN